MQIITVFHSDRPAIFSDGLQYLTLIRSVRGVVERSAASGVLTGMGDGDIVFF
jgi:hypothetical protein